MSYIAAVCEFNQNVLGIAQRQVGSLLSEKEADISHKCLQEELDEFIEALITDDYIDQVDALIDLTYFAFGVLYKLGLTPGQIEACCNAVHEANMQKKLGVNAKRATGAADAVKAEGWVSPETRIHKILFG